jgi:hypothetical protein
MNLKRIALAAIAAFFAYFAVGGIVFGLSPWMKDEFRKYPNVYRSEEGIKRTMPIVTESARFGVLIGLFALGSFVVHSDVNLPIEVKRTVQQGVAYFGEWVIVGLVIGLSIALRAKIRSPTCGLTLQTCNPHTNKTDTFVPPRGHTPASQFLFRPARTPASAASIPASENSSAAPGPPEICIQDK